LSNTRRLSIVPGREGGDADTERAALTTLSDEALLAEFRAGRDAAFDVLYLRYRDRILAYLRGMISDAALAEEVYNSTMYRIYSRLPEGLEAGHFRRYVYKAAFNGCLNATRREANLKRTPPEGLSWGGAPSSSFEEASPEERLSSGQLLELARQYLNELPEERRSALLLYHNDGLSYQEIADVLGKPIGTIRWLIHEARATMARRLQSHTGIRRGRDVEHGT
jgi:RNA polymerase sigma-70 factor (ECF subfamily)